MTKATMYGMAVAEKTAQIDLQQVLRKIQTTSRSAQQAIADFVDFIAYKEAHNETVSSMVMSEEVFAKVWDNEEDAEYDNL